MADRIQFRRDTAARWSQFNPVLMEGEMGIVTDNPNQYKIGDGVHAWNELPLRGFDGTLVHELGTSENAAMSQKAITRALYGEEARTNILSTNMINPQTVKFGSYINGIDIEVEGNFCHTEFIKVTPGMTYVTRSIDNYISGFEYDSNMQQLRLITFANTLDKTFTASDDCQFVILNFGFSSSSKETILKVIGCFPGNGFSYARYGIEETQNQRDKKVSSLYKSLSKASVGSGSAQNVLMQGDSLQDLGLFDDMNSNGHLEHIVPVYPYEFIESPIQSVSLKAIQLERIFETLPIYPWIYRNLPFGHHLRVWTNYNDYGGNIVAHILYVGNVYSNVTFTKAEIVAGAIKETVSAYGTIVAKIISVQDGYCEIDMCVIAENTVSKYDADIVIYDSASSSGIYKFFGFKHLAPYTSAVDLQTLSNILPEKEKAYVSSEKGYLEIIKAPVGQPNIQTGYIDTMIDNPIEGVDIDKIHSTKKVSGSIIYPFEYISEQLSGEFGIWIKKSDYSEIMRVHLAFNKSEGMSFIYVDFTPSDIYKGSSKGNNNGNDYSFSATCTENSGDYYYFVISYQCNLADALSVELVVYEQNEDESGATLDKTYQHLCFVGEGANAYNLNQKVSINAIKGNENSGVKLALPDTIQAEYNKPLLIFKHCINTAFNYRNFNIQVVMDNDVTSGKDYDRYWLYQPQVTGNVVATFYLYDNSRNLLDKKEVVINVVQRTSQPSENKTVLFIGDSLTFYNRITDEFYRLLTSNDEQTTIKDTLSIYDVIKFAGRNWGNVSLIGTQKQNYRGWTGATFHEGYSGWAWADFIKSGSPFFIGGTLDFNSYLSNNSFDEPDVIYIGLGWNDYKNVIQKADGTFDVSVVMSQASTFLTALTNQLPNAKVRLWTENVPGTKGGIGNHPYGSVEGADEHLWKLIQIAIAEGYKNLIKSFPNVGLVWATAQIDSEYSLQESESNVNTRINFKTTLGVDYVHPADAGFFQIADALVSDFVSLI